MSILGSINIGTRGLAASQLALNVLGQNVSNANTEGYSRKRLELTSAIRADAQFGEMGFGVEIENVNRINDEFLESQIRLQVTEQGYYESLDATLERIENILTEPSDSGLNLILDNFWNSWQDLANNPEDPASRDVVRSSGLVVQDKLHTLAYQLEDLRSSQDADLASKVEEVNGIIKEIYSLNEEVSVAEIKDGEANDSRDRRELLMQRLSELIDIDAVEDGLGRLTITTAGNVIVGPSTYVSIELERVSGTDRFGNTIAEVGLRFGNTKRPYVPRGGELKGLLDSRDEIIPKYQNYLDQIAQTLVTQVNNIHRTGYNIAENTGVNFWDSTRTRADNISLSAAIQADSLNIAAAAGGLEQTVPPFGATIPPVGTVLDLTAVSPAYQNIIEGSVQIQWAGPPPRTLREGAGADYVVDYRNGTVTFLNYAAFPDPNPINIGFSYNQAGFPGPGDGSNALSIAQIRDQLTMGNDGLGNPTETVGEYYASLMGELGIERNQAESTLETRRFLVDQFKARKQEISGVSLDEELADMIRYEHTYQASARYITTINSLLDTLLSM